MGSNIVFVRFKNPVIVLCELYNTYKITYTNYEKGDVTKQNKNKKKTTYFGETAQKDHDILVGDLNINTQQGGSSHKQLLDVTKAYNLTVTINIPTQ
jgi:hypothetical protein